LASIDFTLKYDIIVKDMKLTIIAVLFFASFFTTFTTSAEGRWVRDRGVGSIEVVVTEKPSTPPSVILVNTNANTKVSVVVSTNTAKPAEVVYQQTNWPVKVSTTAGSEKPTEYKATAAQVQEPRRKKGFFGRFFGPSQPMMTDAISQSSLPADPVRRRSLDFTMMNGSYNYHHSQGTDTYAEKSWDDYGPREVVHQSTYVNTSESYYPERRRRWVSTYYDNSGVQARTVTWP
jgi:hypothetical protein